MVKKRSADNIEENSGKRRKMDENASKESKKEEEVNNELMDIIIINNMPERTEAEDNQTFQSLNQPGCSKDLPIQKNESIESVKDDVDDTNEEIDLNHLIEDVSEFIKNNTVEDADMDNERENLENHNANLFESTNEFVDKPDDLHKNSRDEDPSDNKNEVASSSNTLNLSKIVKNHLLTKPILVEQIVERKIKPKNSKPVTIEDKKEENWDVLHELNIMDQDWSTLVQGEPSTSTSFMNSTVNIEKYNLGFSSLLEQSPTNKKITADGFVDDENDKVDDDDKHDLKIKSEFSDDTESSDDENNKKQLVEYMRSIEQPGNPQEKNIAINLKRTIKNLLDCEDNTRLEPVNKHSADIDSSNEDESLESIRSNLNRRTDERSKDTSKNRDEALPETNKIKKLKQVVVNSNNSHIKSNAGPSWELKIKEKIEKFIRERDSPMIPCGPLIVRRIRYKNSTQGEKTIDIGMARFKPIQLVTNKNSTQKDDFIDDQENQPGRKITNNETDIPQAYDKVAKQIEQQILRDKSPSELTINTKNESTPPHLKDHTYNGRTFRPLTMQQRLHIYIKRKQMEYTSAPSEIQPLKNRFRIAEPANTKNDNSSKDLNNPSKSIVNDQANKESLNQSENLIEETGHSPKGEKNKNSLLNANMNRKTQDLNVKAFMEGLITNEKQSTSNESAEISSSSSVGNNEDRQNGHSRVRLNGNAKENVSRINEDRINGVTDQISNQGSQNETQNGVRSEIVVKQVRQIGKQNYDPTNLESLRRKNLWHFVLPAEYDANDTEWTLKYRENSPGLVELGKGVYVSQLELKRAQKESKDCKDFAKLLLKEIYNKKALGVCASMSEKAEDEGSQRRPDLDLHAWMVLMNKVVKEGYKRVWDTKRKSILDALHRTVLKYRFKYGVLVQVS